MSASIEQVALFVVRCSTCGRKESFTEDHPAAVQYRDQHDDEHAQSRIVAPAIVDDTFRTDDPAHPYYGHIQSAIDAATAAGKAFLTWNERVYRTADVDFSRPVCWTADLPEAAS